MTAQEARLTAKRARDEAIEAQLASIYKKIEECAQKGEFVYSADGTLNLGVSERLTADGYKIEEGQQYNESWYAIKW